MHRWVLNGCVILRAPLKNGGCPVFFSFKNRMGALNLSKVTTWSSSDLVCYGDVQDAKLQTIPFSPKRPNQLVQTLQRAFHITRTILWTGLALGGGGSQLGRCMLLDITLIHQKQILLQPLVISQPAPTSLLHSFNYKSSRSLDHMTFTRGLRSIEEPDSLA